LPCRAGEKQGRGSPGVWAGQFRKKRVTPRKKWAQPKKGFQIWNSLQKYTKFELAKSMPSPNSKNFKENMGLKDLK
jgi:hypothetical protein